MKHSIDYFESIFKSCLPETARKDSSLMFISYKRNQQEGRYESSSVYEYTPLSGDSSGWEGLVRRANKPGFEVGLDLTISHGREDDSYFVALDMLPGLMKDCLETTRFWEMLRKLFPGKKAYIFDSGNSYHLLINTLIQRGSFIALLFQASKYPKVMDTGWAYCALNKGSKILRVLPTDTRIQPKLVKWVNL
jgi:hypothetical protein